jgi:hypothetical protein
MPRRVLIAALLPALALATGNALAQQGTYPDWEGQWARLILPEAGGTISHDQTKPLGYGQEAPLTAEYRLILEASLADQVKGGLGNFPTGWCQPGGMPLTMIAFRPLEFVVTPNTTYVLIGSDDHYRRIYTDGRDWPVEIVPTYAGYSIGRWIDEDGDGRYDVLDVETRGFKGPRAYDNSGLPLHFDNQSVFRERLYRDRADPNIFHDEITVVDNALTRPWTVDKKYVRSPLPHPDWPEYYCSENNQQIIIGKQNYFLSSDGLLMPVRKDQSPPDLRHFNPSRQ